MEKFKLYRSKLILENKELDVEAVNLLNIQSVLHFAENTLRISSYPEEITFLICMNPQKKCINYFELSRGTLLESFIGMKELMKRVLISNSHSFLLIHNHPSGDAIPTNEDFNVTSDIAKAAKLLDIEFIDHVIIGQENFVSLRELARKENRIW